MEFQCRIHYAGKLDIMEITYLTIKTQLIQSGFQDIVVTRSYTFCESLYISCQIHQRRRTVNTELHNTVSAADTEAQYDEKQSNCAAIRLYWRISW